jgi:hypothetical protein
MNLLVETKSVFPLRFVPMTGEAEKKPRKNSRLDGPASGPKRLVVAEAS